MTDGGRSSGVDQLLGWIEQDRGRLIGFLQDFTRIDTCNPPGDTRGGADLVAAALQEAGLAFNTVAPRADKPNLVASVAGPAPGRHLVLNGHIDVFPIGDHARWTRDPLGGALDGGRVWGRGTVDMKAGTTASLFAYLYVARLIDRLPGRLTLTVVSDEETGGRWGADYLTEHLAGEVLGDCLLNGEPSSIHTIRFAEKAMFWLTVRVRTPGGHGAYPHLSASATRIACELVTTLSAVEQVRACVPAEITEHLARLDVVAAIERGLGRGATDVMQRATLNVGRIEGGVAINMLPGDCMVTVDIRLPLGVKQAEMRALVDDITGRFPGVSIEAPAHASVDPTFSDLAHPMVGILQDSVDGLLGFRPPPIVSLGGTDARFWRRRGVPAYVYGPSPAGMGSPDESVLIEEFLHIVRTHTISAWRYLNGTYC